MAPALLTAVDSTDHVHLVIGTNPLAGARCTKSLEVGARVKLIAPAAADLHYGLQKHIDDGRVEWVKKNFEDDDVKTLGREEVYGFVDGVFVTLGGKHPLGTHISTLCRRLRIPVNVTDAPALCTFTLLSTHTDGPLQIGTTTSGKGCKLASRIRREIVSSLPSGLGAAVDRLGAMRRRIWEEDHAAELSSDIDADLTESHSSGPTSTRAHEKKGYFDLARTPNDHATGSDEDDTPLPSTFNKLITPLDASAARSRRIRWLSQICEYWPLSRLASLTDSDIEAVLRSYSTSSHSSLSTRTLDARRRRGKIVLAGSGPGNPDLLTTACLKAIKSADLILADKLVPGAVMSLIPRRCAIKTAQKYPGNADNAQEQLLDWGLEGLQAGLNVVRLKQGDPYIYGRGAEEWAFFARHGYTPVVIPGITSALSAPVFAGIPPTHRGVADEVLICTGTGRKGASPKPPEYVVTRTVVFLMALHRLGDLVKSLVGGGGVAGCGEGEGGVGEKVERGTPWPENTPCAVVERASCPDQRVIRTTLRDVCAAVEEEGSRPPGLLLVGRSCEVLYEKKQRWVVEDGFRALEGLEDVDALAELDLREGIGREGDVVV